MKDIITYSLYNEEDKSDKYYKDISIFTNYVVENILICNHKYIKDFQEFILKNKVEDLRSKLEYSLEFLILGVLWITYINKAMALKSTPKNILTKLSNLREKSSIKKSVDNLRGVLATLYLDKEDNKNIEPTLEKLSKLILWLEATGEFKQEVKRLKLWQQYLKDRTPIDVKNILSSSIYLGKWFKAKSEEKLGCYTENVNSFIKKANDKYKWREDYIFCRRKRVEYHLNMVGAEIMNKAFREEFLKTNEKILFLPACMRANSNKDCNATKTKNGYLCVGCTNSCKVKKYTELGEKYNFKVYIIHHESSVFRDKSTKENIGIIGVACILNLISGGWKAKNYGFIPQCVLLDYCGCKKHWHERGIITDISVNRLLYTIGVKEQEDN